MATAPQRCIPRSVRARQARGADVEPNWPALYRLHLGVADSMSIARIWARLYSKFSGAEERAGKCGADVAPNALPEWDTMRPAGIGP